jgi:hypothetical protein
MSLIIAFQFPAGAGFYWAVSAAIGIVQSLVIYKMWPPEKLRAEVEDALDARGYKNNVVVIEKHDGKKVQKKASEMSGKEEKEYYRKKLEAARLADLERYGDVETSAAAARAKIDEAEAESAEIEAELLEIAASKDEDFAANPEPGDSPESAEPEEECKLGTCKHCGASNDKERKKCRSCDKPLSK